MSQALGLLLEILVLIALGLLYYYYQKRKIIRQDQIEIMQLIDEILRGEENISQARDYLHQLGEASNTRNYSVLYDLTQNPHPSLSQDAKEALRDMDDRIKFYLK